MRKFLLIIILSFLSSSIFSKSVDLDSAIKSAGEIIVSSARSANLKIIAVTDFKAETEKMSSYIYDKLSSAIIKKGGVTLVSRNTFDKVLKELNFQASGYVDDETALSFCKQLGAQGLVFGEFKELGEKDYQLTVKMIGVETSAYVVFEIYEISSLKKIKNLLKQNENQVYSNNTKNTSSERNPSYSQSRPTLQKKSPVKRETYSDSEEHKISFGACLEGNQYSVKYIALCSGGSFDYEITQNISAGAKINISGDFLSKDVSILTIEPLATARLYLFSPIESLESRIFIEAQGGAAIISVDDEVKYAPSCAGEIGWRFENLRSEPFYIEPYIRVGYPFIIGEGLYFGLTF